MPPEKYIHQERHMYRDNPDEPTPPNLLPPTVRLPRAVIAALFVAGRTDLLTKSRLRYGPAAILKLPGQGDVVSVSDPALAKKVFTAPADVLHGGDENPLKEVLGEKSMFGLDQDDHLRARRLLLPPFHGKRMGEYETIFEEETLAAIADWPIDRDFATLESMMQITLRAIIRTVFGAEGKDYEELREHLPPWVALGSLIIILPVLRRNFGPWSPWAIFQRRRKRYDAIVDRLIERGRNDPKLEERNDVLSMLLQARYEDGEPMSRDEIADQLLTILTAGHETTAGSLAWTFERIRRHPKLLGELVAEARTGGKELREATALEVQRNRPVIIGAFRYVSKPFQLGPWLLPPGTIITVDALTSHNDSQTFPDPKRFSPERFLGAKPGTYDWVPFGGGRRRCVGAAFALLEMDVVLRTILTRCEIVPTSERDERPFFRGVTLVPRRGGRLRVRAIDTRPGSKTSREAMEPAVEVEA
ncbi:MAG: cytochrome P450 [Solirubrobacterales bacterium]